uniref:Serine/threonine-protein kinase nek2 n=1 Tax=Cucumis melo TaxID=3656 RepID=A0A9I9E723_CUCME
MIDDSSHSSADAKPPTVDHSSHSSADAKPSTPDQCIDSSVTQTNPCSAVVDQPSVLPSPTSPVFRHARPAQSFTVTKQVGDMNPTVMKQTYFMFKIFVVDSRSKKTIIQNAGVCFRQFKYRLTTTYVLPFLDDVEKLKFPPNEYSFIDQQHWTEFVASRLKEHFKKKSENGKEKRKKHNYNHRTSRKGYANLMEELDELVATQNTTNTFGEKDILTRALGGKDRPGIFRGVGKYVTKKKYFHTAIQQKTNEKEDEKATPKEHDRMVKRIKELEEELLKMKEKDDCVGDLKEEPGMSSKEKSSMEGAENVNDLEDLSNELE